MRVGSNPQKFDKKIDLETHHRVIVVVYIPNEDGFYKNSYDVFKLCLDSLVSSINTNCAITIVNNGSSIRVTNLLNEYLENDKIDTVIHHKRNIGKIDALIGAARGAREQLITYSDSDILFLNGWQENVEKVFTSFPNVGAVSPIPVRKGIFAFTSSVLGSILLNKVKFKFESIPNNFDTYNRYLESINWDLETDDKKLWPVVYKDSAKAIIGSGHQVLTISRDIALKSTPLSPSLILVGGDSENNYVDRPIDFSGKLRLSTYENYAYHMGNTLEEWMLDQYKMKLKTKVEISIDKEIIKKIGVTPNSKIKLKIYSLRKRIAKKIFKFKYKKSINY